ncbi:MAG: SusC/RagA family TonB-linked outer membrane protein [Marinifilaceae bacterium]|jgi:TonB-linked SusC/RagA family outer membrane protein|nr:SusC/RagA family TonB-linked outer membrane protein [Marinifilaceae bacterium]
MKKKRKSVHKGHKKLLSLLLVICLSMPTFAGIQEKKVSLKMKSVSVQEVIEKIGNQIEMGFLYRGKELKNHKLENVNYQDVDWKEVVKEVLDPIGKTFKIEKDLILIIDKNKEVEKNQQKKTSIKGKVTDKQGVLLPGVTIMLDGTYTGTTTNTEGLFSLKVPDNKGTLIVSFVGFKTQRIKFSGNEELTITMDVDVSGLDEVVVTGYSSVRRKDYVGSAVTVKMKDAIVAGVSNVDEMLAGTIPGMTVSRSSGMVGTSAQVRVRGTSTLLGSQSPLWVVDGVIQRNPSAQYNTEGGLSFTNNDSDMTSMVSNAISWLNPNDIENITVLKDASATAIYGSAAANGVIVINTKRSNKEQLNINYTGELSLGMAPSYRMYDRMNSKEMMRFSFENYQSGMQYPSKPIELGFVGIIQKLHNKQITVEEYQKEYNKLETINTDWFDMLFRNSLSNKHSLSISAGTKNISTRASFGFEDTKGEAIGNDMTQYTATSNSTLSLENGIKVNLGLKASIREVDGFAYDVNPFDYAYNTSRVIEGKDKEGNYVYHSKYGRGSTAISGLDKYDYNIFNEIDNTGLITKNKNFGVFGDVQVPFLKKFKYKGMFSYDFASNTVKSWATENSNYITQIRGYEFGQYSPNSPEQNSSRLPFGGVLRTDDINTDSWTFRNDFIYDNFIESKHRITGQLGVELSSTERKGNQNTTYGYMPDRGETFAAVPIQYYKFGNTSGTAEENLLLDEMRLAKLVMNRKNNYFSSYFLGVYSYKAKYIFNASGRIDASNRFGQDKNKRWQPTWSVGLKWNASAEEFAKELEWLNLATISASYGFQGNTVESVSPYLIASRAVFDNYTQQFKMGIKSLSNPDLGWEKTKTTNIGVQLAMFDSRLNFNLDYYHKNSDVLSSRTVAYENGVTNSYVEGVEMENSGYDFVVNLVPIKNKKFNWQLSLNFGKVKNKLSSAIRTNTLDDYLTGNAVVNGSEFSTLYSFKFKALSPEDGRPIFDLGKDLEGEDYIGEERNKITDEPLDYLVKSGSAIPDFSGGFNTRLQYDNWSLYMQFQMQFGGVGRLPALYDYTQKYGVPYPDANVSTKLINRWKKPGDENTTNIPSVPGVSQKLTMYVPSETSSWDTYKIYQFSDAQIAKTDMIRCGQISLAYELDKEITQRLKLNRVNFRLGVTNPFFIAFDKKWDGVDPETGNWPLRKMYTFTLNVSL